jgi:methyl-accepting chemotaxis protein
VKLKEKVRMWRFSLSKKLLLWGVIFVGVPLLTVGIISDYKVTAMITATAQREGLQKAKELANTIQVVLNKEIHQANGLSSLDAIRRTALKVRQEGVANAREEIQMLNRELLAILKGLGRQYSGMYVADPKGIAFAGVLSNGETADYFGKDFSERDYFKGASQDKPTISSIIVSKVTNRPVMSVGIPIRSDSGEFLGVLAVTSDVDFLINLVVRARTSRS